MLPLDVAGEPIDPVVLDMGNPQCVLLGPLPDEPRFRRLGAALERHAMFPEGTNVEFAHVEAPDRVRILIWERGVGPTSSSGTGSCAALVAAASFGGAARDADVVAPGGAQRVEWRADSVYLTGWAEVLVEGEWLRQIPRTAVTGTAWQISDGRDSAPALGGGRSRGLQIARSRRSALSFAAAAAACAAL